MYKLIVGLGNPGLNFNFTPHNVGFMLIDYLLKEF
ncbi:MAG: aminoacyl-tRNA hydrolase, partial [Sweet potato little leaf phytoplasma]|nr:aminoacyl-tRNA hydrolase [Sweet potato little leaf phytoplasma]